MTVQTSNGGTLTAMASNISGAGMLLHFEQPPSLEVGDEVTVEAELPDDPGKPFPAWGIAKTVHKQGCRVGIRLDAGAFEPGNRPLREDGPAPVDHSS